MGQSSLLGLFAVVLATTLVMAQGNTPPSPASSRPGGVEGPPVPGQATTPRRDTNGPQATTGTGRISGRVVTTGASTPIRRAQLWLLPGDNPQQLRRTTFTDPQGLFEFRDLPAGKFTLTASKPGYLSLEFGQRRPYESGTPLVLNAGQALSSVNFALPRGSVIAGRVTDEFGEPMTSVTVQAQRFQYSTDGWRQLVTARSASTDDRGEFRVFGLMPGEYVVNGQINPTLETGSANPDTAAPRDAYPSTFYPGTPNVNEAQAITLGIGEESGVSFALASARLVRVSGTARDSEERPFTGQMYLMPRNQLGGTRLLGAIRADGSFTITGVPPGDYTLDALRTPSRTETVPEFGSVPVTVAGADISGLRVTTTRGAVVRGRVIWEGSAPRPGTGARSRVLALNVTPVSAALPATLDPNATGQIGDDGGFEIGGVYGRILLTANIGGWTIKSVRRDGRDITHVPIETLGRSAIDGLQVVMTDKLQTLTGSVTDDRGAAATQFVVVVQPADDMEPAVAGRYVRTIRPDTNGRFEFRDLRPGRYLATAIEVLEQGRQYSPEFRQQLRRGAREFTLREGETLTLQLNLTTGL